MIPLSFLLTMGLLYAQLPFLSLCSEQLLLSPPLLNLSPFLRKERLSLTLALSMSLNPPLLRLKVRSFTTAIRAIALACMRRKLTWRA
jgi:hypothetical protein